jgi:plasmid stability protein
MSVALQIRDVPEDVRDVIARRAATRGQSMQRYLLDVLQREARMDANVEAFERTAPHRVTIPTDLDITAMIREGREQGAAVDRGELSREIPSS